MKNLIVNADDFGWAEGVNRGIVEAHRNGIVTSTSLLANGAAFASAVELARAEARLGVGVHLNLSNGAPLADAAAVSSLLNGNREFAATPDRLLLRIMARKVKLDHVETEWESQIRRVRDAGIAPTHLDGHKHVHMLPGLFEVALRLAKRHGIRAIRISHETSTLRAALAVGTSSPSALTVKQGIRARGLKVIARDARHLAERAGLSTSDYFCGIAQTGELTKEGVARLLTSLPDGTTELMCHPGYADATLARSATRLQSSREKEVAILTDPQIRKLVASQGIRLIDYACVVREA